VTRRGRAKGEVVVDALIGTVKLRNAHHAYEHGRKLRFHVQDGLVVLVTLRKALMRKVGRLYEYTIGKLDGV